MYGLNIDPENPKGNPAPTELLALGVRAVRYSFIDLERTPGDQPTPARLQFYAAKLRAYSEARIASLIILTYDTYPNKPAHNASDGEWESYIAQFARRAGQIAQAFAPLRPAFQIWNEPDHPPLPHYAPTLREAVFGRMMRQTYDAVKAASPNSRVIAGGLASGNPDWLARVIQAQGGSLPADAIAIHPYGQRPEPTWPTPTWLHGYVGKLIERYQQVAGGRPIWISEVGAKPEEVDQAGYLQRIYRTIATQFGDQVPQVFWFCYSDGMVSPFGLKDEALRPKPAYEAYRQVAAAAPQSTPPVQPTAPAPTPSPPQPVQPVTPTQPTLPYQPSTFPQPAMPPAFQPTTPASPFFPSIPAIPGISPPFAPQVWGGVGGTAFPNFGMPSFQPTLPPSPFQLSLVPPPTLPGGSFFPSLPLQPGVSPFNPSGSLFSAMPFSPTPFAPPYSPAPFDLNAFAPPPTPNFGGAPALQIVDRSAELPQRSAYPTRSLNEIQQILIHHTATLSPEELARQMMQAENLPGLPYHYLIETNGKVIQTQPLNTALSRAALPGAEGRVDIAFVGEHTSAQLQAGGLLCRQLVPALRLSLSDIVGLASSVQALLAEAGTEPLYALS
jgi:hypothetical protein